MKLTRVLRDIYQTWQPKPWLPVKPHVIQFPVNDICNAGCQMCNIWQQKLDYQIQPAELEIALDNPLFSDVRTVGINGGEPTLRKDLAELTEVLFRRLPSLETISLITNAFVPQKVISRIEEVGEVIKKYKANYDIMVSLDGVGAVHDLVRGRKGNFNNAVKVLNFLQTSGIASNLRLGCTVIRDNVFGLHDLHDFALERDIYIKYRLGIPHQRLYSDSLTDPFELTPEEKAHFCIFLENLILHYEESELQKFFYRSLVDQVMHGRARQAGCAWQHRGATITARGELLYCAVKSKTLGSAVLKDSEQLYFGNTAHLSKIVERECDTCLHDYTGLPPGPVFLKHLLKEIAARSRIPSGIFDSNNWPAPIKQLGQQWTFRTRLKLLDVPAASSKPATEFRPRKEPGEPFRILVCGWYGTETLGDKAILAGVVSTLRDTHKNTSFHIASLEPYITKLTVMQMPELSGTDVINIREALELTGYMDLVVFGGGPIMAVKSLADMLAIFERAATHKIPTILAGCGVGPLGSNYQNKMIKRLLELASVRIYRDEQSLAIASGLGVDTGSDLVAEDPAFTWIAGKPADTRDSGREPGDEETRILLGLRDWPHHQYARRIGYARARKIQNRFENAIIKGLEGLLKINPHVRIIPFPMCTNHYGGDDRWFNRRLFRDSTTLRNSMDYSTLSRELTPDEAIAVYKSTHAALTMRFHSLVFAVGLGIPAIACDYTMGDGKVAALAESSGIPCRPIDSIDADFITTSLLSALKNGNVNTPPVVTRLPIAINNALKGLG